MGVIAAEGLAIGYGARRVARGIDFTLAPGEVICILGPNGAGKTTLFRTLLGLAPPLAGGVRIAGRAIGTLSRAEIARSVAYVPQALHVPFPYSVRDLVLMGRTARLGPFEGPRAVDHARAEAALASLGIGDLADAPVTSISGGQRQLALIARALAQDAAAIVLDEPAASLDFGNRERLLARIAGLAASGLGLVISTHEPDHAARVADRVLTIDRTGAVEIGDARAMLTAGRIAALYDLPVEVVKRRVLV